MSEETTYNQKQYKRARFHKTRCRICKNEIIWMKSVEGKFHPVDPLKVINSTPGIRIMGEDGIIMVNTMRKIGWKMHECRQDASRKIGSLASVWVEQPSFI